MIKLIGQLVLAASITGLVPVDAAQLEYQANADTGSAFGLLPASQTRQLYAGLPLAENRIDYPIKVDQGSYGIVTTARSALVMDVESGAVLYEKRPDEIRSIGSVTKLMTALIFLEQNPDLGQIVELDTSQDLVYGGRIYLHFRDGLSLGDVLAASLVGSDNSATQSLIRFSGLTEDAFIRRMNEKAYELGMTSTTFTGPTGIDAGNISTARDITKLLSAAESTEEIKRHMMQPSVVITQASGRSATVDATNEVLESFLNEDPYAVEAGKTGYLPQAGYVLSTIIREGEHSIYVVVLGSESKETRISETKGLAAWAFKTFQWPDEL